ncbi:MAG: NADH-quinone oxidoreductase subunit M [Roseiflexaceae bacterium]
MPAYLFSNSPLPILTMLVLAPLVGMLLIGIAGLLRLDDRIVKIGATLWSLIPLGLAIFVYAGFDPNEIRDGQQVIQFVERIPWTDAIRVEYFLGVDGLSLPMVLLTAVMTPVALLASFSVDRQVKAHYAMLLLLEAAMLGYFVSLNFFFFFIFWEFSLVPAFFLIQGWGREGDRKRPAAFGFFVYTLAGSIGMLLLFLLLYAATGAAGRPTFDLIELARLGLNKPVEGLSGNLQTILFSFLDTSSPWLTDSLGRFPLLYASIAFWAMFIAFAIKLAIWPFHTWLPDAYSEAPTAGSILLSAVMSKMGAYGMLRLLLPLFPQAASISAALIGGLALIGVIIGAFGALSQTQGDLKRLIAYTSINHMGYVGLAVAALAAMGPGALPDSRAAALNGASMQMVAHGLSTGALFLLAGIVAERAGTYRLSELGGLRASMPVVAGLMGIATFANLGLPGMAGFVGELLIMRGLWAALPVLALLATIGLVITALALLRMYGQIFHGPLVARSAGDLPLISREFLALLPLVIAMIALGIYPAPIVDLSNRAITLLGI